ncbi:hypothetical protein Pcinc_013298 [Petrolisthes cinctipes]|uniref:Uncharacterized protein n=1 Tax=Petrolisthes cinctipes TaxID=88211 RepID=A0AAE1FZ48_PETCI|nr:hypothetical protein Pcinc_013298 [Petrolisthes cinctipes]
MGSRSWTQVGKLTDIITRFVEKSRGSRSGWEPIQHVNVDKTCTSQREQLRIKESTCTGSESLHKVRPKHKERELGRHDVSRPMTQHRGSLDPPEKYIRCDCLVKQEK